MPPSGVQALATRHGIAALDGIASRWFDQRKCCQPHPDDAAVPALRLALAVLLIIVAALPGRAEPSESSELTFGLPQPAPERPRPYVDPRLAVAAPPEHCGGPPMLRFSTPVAAESEIVIAAVGDVLLHGSLQRQAFAHPDGFRSLWAAVEPVLAGADLAYANLEGPIAEGVTKAGSLLDMPVERFDDWVYSSYPMFNYHPALATDLVASGVDVVSTANNHALDRFAVGADRTIEALSVAGLPFTGTRPADRPEHPWYALTEAGGYRIAWLACTYSTNGVSDPHDQVLFCFEDEHTVLSQIVRLSRDPAIDAVILTPHWGGEYSHRPDSRQQSLGRAALEAGATAVIGSHPHVIQPWERHVTRDGREGLILYSLGNFVSGQRELPRRTAIVLLLGLAEMADGRLAVAGARYLPIRFDFAGGADGRTLGTAPVTAANDGGSLGLLARLLHPGNAVSLADRLSTVDACTPRVTRLAETEDEPGSRPLVLD